MNNPLLETNGLPAFSAIEPVHVRPAIERVLEANRHDIRSILSRDIDGWDSLVVPIEDLQHRLNTIWSPVRHLNAVRNSEELRNVYNECLPLLTEYHTEFGQNEALFRAYLRLEESAGSTLSPAHSRAVKNTVRDFRLAGVDLSGEKKSRFKAIMQKLASLSAKFEENLLDATNAWTHHIDDAQQLRGLPEQVLELTSKNARESGQEGWLLSLDFPTYHAILTHAHDRSLRKTYYEAWMTRASDRGPMSGRFDNGGLIPEILALRHETAQLLGFDNYAQYSLATKMAGAETEVMEFLKELAEHSVPAARKEIEELETFAGQTIEAWDLAYFAERYKQQRLQLSEDQLRPYFPLPRVLSGMFDVARHLYGVEFEEDHDFDSWHPDVRLFAVRNAAGEPRGEFYVDLYARPAKRGGAWMDECVVRKALGNGTIANPVAYLVCNFMPPVGEAPALLTHAEVVTLFHEFGHTLHHLMTTVDIPSVAGVNGVPWDAVELPSQFMENYAWQPEVLPLISGHYQTGAALPEDKFEMLKASRAFHAGLHSVRQLEFGIFDFRLHSEYSPEDPPCVLDVLKEVRSNVAVVPVPEFVRFPHGFSHIFAGGYSAGYYSYKWAEVLAADAFAAFEERGLFDRRTADAFRSEILERGGACDAMEAFVSFRGRKPQIEHLLRQSGMLR